MKSFTPLLDLSILVAALILLNLTWQTNKIKWYSMFGLVTLIFADLLYFYLVTIEGLIEGVFIQPLWLLGVLLIGVSGFYASDYDEGHPSRYSQKFSLRQEILSYVVILILITFVTYSYGWEINSLSLGLTFILVMTIVRNIFLISRNLQLVSQYQYLAYHDNLTGLLNRSKFNEDLDQIMSECQQKTKQVALIMVDLDNFKPVNDHYVGDVLLQQVANRLGRAIEGDGILYRIGAMNLSCWLLRWKVVHKALWMLLLNNLKNRLI